MMRWYYDQCYMGWRREDGVSISDEKIFNLDQPLRGYILEVLQELSQEPNERLGNSVLAALSIDV